jgi:hypothetical protein
MAREEESGMKNIRIGSVHQETQPLDALYHLIQETIPTLAAFPDASQRLRELWFGSNCHCAILASRN